MKEVGIAPDLREALAGVFWKIAGWMRDRQGAT